jgi:hypothetical protein
MKKLLALAALLSLSACALSLGNDVEILTDETLQSTPQALTELPDGCTWNVKTSQECPVGMFVGACSGGTQPEGCCAPRGDGTCVTPARFDWIYCCP